MSMLELSKLTQYKENNRIEAKLALGGLPKSLWETYSAFANTLGGMILLGVEETAEHALRPVDLPDPERLVREFWDIVNDPQKVSANVLMDRHVRVEEVEGRRIVAITVPRARRYDRPVYLGSSVYHAYRRSGEGDYKCSRKEVQAMLRDAARETQDMQVLENMDLAVLDYDTVQRYRWRMQNLRPGHVWETWEDAAFLEQIGAVRETRGALHPTAAGLLMFGYEYEIVKVFPQYSLDFQAWAEDGLCEERLLSAAGDWSGNLYDFYLRVYPRLKRQTKKRLQNQTSAGEAVYEALREALVNCLINADYWGAQGVVVEQYADRVRLSNPGGFRVEPEAARQGGMSDPRNCGLARMFNLIGIGQGLGSGISNIYAVWREQGWDEPQLTELFEPERISLQLTMAQSSCTQKEPERKVHPSMALARAKKAAQQVELIDYLTRHIAASAVELAAELEAPPERVRALLHELVEQEVIEAEDEAGRRVYRLKG